MPVAGNNNNIRWTSRPWCTVRSSVYAGFALVRGKGVLGTSKTHGTEYWNLFDSSVCRHGARLTLTVVLLLFTSIRTAVANRKASFANCAIRYKIRFAYRTKTPHQLISYLTHVSYRCFLSYEPHLFASRFSLFFFQNLTPR